MSRLTLENDMGKDDIKRLVLRLALPSMAAQFVNILYSIVDRIYVGNIAGIGELALAALGVCTPVVTLIGAFSALIGIGGAPLISIKLGEGDKEGAQKIASNGLLMLIISSIFATVISTVFTKQILFAFGASKDTFLFAKQYFSVYVLGSLFAIVGTGLNYFIMAQGYASITMKSVIIGAVTNIILDPIFIFTFKMNVTGAAVATVLAQMASCAYTIRFLLRKDIPVNIGFGDYDFKVIKKILSIGFVPFIILATDNLILIAMNTTITKFGGMMGDMLLACSTILQSFMSMVTMPLLGITTGTQPILGYNYGSRDTGRVWKAQKYTLLFAIGFTSLMFIIAQTIPHLFAGIFTSNPEYIKITSTAIRMFTLGLIPMAVQYTAVDGFTGIGATKVAISLSLFRKGLFLACVLILPRFFGIMSIFLSEPISDFVGGILSGIMLLTVMGRILEARSQGTI